MNLANQLTVLRILLVPAFIAILFYYSPQYPYLRGVAAAVFMGACLTDALDGYIARKRNERTILGSYLDPIADKLLLLSGFFCLSMMTHLPDYMRIPAWVTIPVISREVIILIGSVLIFLITGTLKAEPLFIGKITTVFQMGTLFSALMGAPKALELFLFAGTTIFTTLSGIFYIRMGGKILQG